MRCTLGAKKDTTREQIEAAIGHKAEILDSMEATDGVVYYVEFKKKPPLTSLMATGLFRYATKVTNFEPANRPWSPQRINDDTVRPAGVREADGAAPPVEGAVS